MNPWNLIQPLLPYIIGGLALMAYAYIRSIRL